MQSLQKNVTYVTKCYNIKKIVIIVSNLTFKLVVFKPKVKLVFKLMVKLVVKTVVKVVVKK